MEPVNLQELKLNKIRTEKSNEYGPFDTNMNLIGRVWSALLGLKNPIPGYLVSLMFTASKLLRARNHFKIDTYDDAKNYLHQAQLMQQKEKNDN